MGVSMEVFCQHAGVCGGCDLLHLSYAEQLRLKATTLRDLLAPVTFELLFPTDRMPSGFRQKVAFVFGAGRGGRGLVMGHYARGSKTIVPVVECPVHSERGNRVAFA